MEKISRPSSLVSTAADPPCCCYNHESNHSAVLWNRMVDNCCWSLDVVVDVVPSMLGVGQPVVVVAAAAIVALDLYE